MAGSFETSDQNSGMHERPLRVPSLSGGIYQTAKELIDDLDGWKLLEEDAAKGLLVCERSARFLGGASRITIRVEGPEGIPSTTVNVRSESSGGLISGDRKNVAEFLRPLHRRVC
jgi:hypothetical protein